MKDLGMLVLGILMLAMGLGLLQPWLERLGLDQIGLGRLPGDLAVDFGDWQLRLPLTSAAAIAGVVALIVTLWKHAAL